MKPTLTRIKTAVWHVIDGKVIEGTHASIRGCVTGIRGDVTGISGDVSGIRGCVTGLRGNVDLCELTYDDREKGVDIFTLVATALAGKEGGI